MSCDMQRYFKLKYLVLLPRARMCQLEAALAYLIGGGETRSQVPTPDEDLVNVDIRAGY